MLVELIIKENSGHFHRDLSLGDIQVLFTSIIEL
jgi:hypothetical protein